MKTCSIFTFSALMLLSALTATAQSTFKLDTKMNSYIDKAQVECIYQYTVNAPVNKDTEEKEGTHKEKVTYKTILQTNASVSKFWDWHSFKMDSIICTATQPLSNDSSKKLSMKYYFAPVSLFLPVILKNFPDGKITVTDEIAANDFTYNGDRTAPAWELSDDTLTVCSYLCNKAICSYGGRKWTAWYSADITISDGPWKLFGLPGLILKAMDDSGTHTFEAIAIRQSDRPIYNAVNMQYVKVKRSDFIRQKNYYEKDPMAYLVKAKAKAMVIAGNLLVDGKRVSWQRKTVYCPLELE